MHGKPDPAVRLSDAAAGGSADAGARTGAPVPSNADRNALASAIDQAIVAGDFAYADRLLADANRRFARDGTWPPLQQKLVRMRAERDTQLRRAEAQRLIDEAWRFAQVGEFGNAETMLQEADKQAPGFADIARARREIAELRTEQRQRYRERYQYQAAIDQAFANEQLWEAERLLAEYAQRFNQDDEYRDRSRRLTQMRAAATWQTRLTQARGFIANARQAMTRGDFAEAERLLERADRAAPGFPETNQARAELSRRRIAAERQQSEIQLLIAAIEAAFQRRQYDDADRAIADGRNRYAAYPGWDELRGRSAAARKGDDRVGNEQRARRTNAMELVTAARRSTTQGDFAAAERSLKEANVLVPKMPEIATASAELERAKADRLRQTAEIKAMQASIDAALQRKQYADAERLLADGAKRYPSDAGWTPRTARLAEERRATPGQTGNAPMPTPAPAPKPGQPAPDRPVAAAPPPATPATPTPPPAAAPKPDASKPVADAKAAIARADFAAAEKAVSEAEKIDAKAAAVVAVRKELNLARLVATARANIRRQNLEAAEKAVADAEKIDAKEASVVKVRAELTAAEEAAKNAPPATAAQSPARLNATPAENEWNAGLENPAFFYSARRHMRAGQFHQQFAVGAGDGGAHDGDALALAHEAGFGGELAVAAIAQQHGVQIDGELEARAAVAELGVADRQPRGANIGEPHHGAGMHGAERIEDARLDRHLADDAIGVLLGDGEVDAAGIIGIVELGDVHCCLFDQNARRALSAAAKVPSSR